MSTPTTPTPTSATAPYVPPAFILEDVVALIHKGGQLTHEERSFLEAELKGKPITAYDLRNPNWKANLAYRTSPICRAHIGAHADHHADTVARKRKQANFVQHKVVRGVPTLVDMIAALHGRQGLQYAPAY